jgi:uncharacterized OsmC-like protein
MSMTATARRVGNTLKHEVDVNGRHVIVTDEPERLGGTDKGPAPHELLAAMLASCVATMIAIYAQNRGWDVGEIVVDVDYDTDSVPAGSPACLSEGVDRLPVALMGRCMQATWRGSVSNT